MAENSRERLGSRLGFLLIAAGCAIGLGNVWRFPYITGLYGGAVFVVVYLFFLLAFGLPILIMEFSIGRASRLNMGGALRALEPKATHWHKAGWFSLVGSYALMMFYIPVSGWMVSYCYHMGAGNLNLPPDQVGAFFGNMLQNPWGMLFWAALVGGIGFGVCAMGVKNGVERVVKVMMTGLLLIMIGLAVKALTLPNAAQGLAFYLAPDWDRAMENGLLPLINAAMNQAFFTLSIGVGSMLIFGSYLNNKRTITGESIFIVCLDLFVALTAGLIIFPTCFAFGINPDSGPGLIFITLPNVFNSMAGGWVWGCLFFVFMSFAALTTVITVLENIISYCVDVWGWSRKKSVLINGIAMFFLIMPCIFGFNKLSWIQPLGEGTNLMDLEDFIISANLLPLGALLFLLFCCTRYGWGWDKFLAEADKGEGPRFPRFLRPYLTWILPCMIIFVFIQGYIQLFGK